MSDQPPPPPDPPPQKPKLLERIRSAVRARQYSPRTEEAYVLWAKRFILFHDKRHPSTMGAAEINAFLASLADDAEASASTQNQALSALLFLYREVLREPVPWLDEIVRAIRPPRIPVILTREETRVLLSGLTGPAATVALLLYGAGLRLNEALQLRVGDVDFGRREILARDTKGRRDRTTMLPEGAIAALRKQLLTAKIVHEHDLRDGWGAAWLPPELIHDHGPHAKEWRWQWVFPAANRWREPNGREHRHHLHPTAVQRAIRAAAEKSGIQKHITSHTLRHTFAVHLLESGHDLRTVQHLLGHRDISATMIYSQLLRPRPNKIRSPLDTP